MSKKTFLFGSAALLCLFSFACKGCGMLFRLYLAGRIGSEGIGLYQLVLSVYSLFASFATAGLTVSVSRITAEELEGVGGQKGAVKALNTALKAAIFLGITSGSILFLLSTPLSSVMLDDARTVMPLKILAFSMPFMSVSSCLKGYYIGSRRIIIPASSQLFEEVCKIAITVGVLSFFMKGTNDTGKLCMGISFGLTSGEIFSFLYVLLFRFIGKRQSFRKGEKQTCSIKRITDIALPVASGSWLTSGLHAVENVLIPYCFSLYGGGQSKALSDFGMIRGMVLPVLFFPFAFISAVISVLIPEISRLNVMEDKSQRNKKISGALALTSVFGFCAGGIFFFFPEEISTVFYGSAESADTMRILALITPFMYIETISDALLKGIGEQKFTTMTTFLNCVFRIAAVFLLIPSTGAKGYVWLLVISNIFSFIMCYGRLAAVSSVGIKLVRNYAFPAVCAAFSGFVSKYTVECVGKCETIIASIIGCVIFILLYGILYITVMKLGHRKVI